LPEKDQLLIEVATLPAGSMGTRKIVKAVVTGGGGFLGRAVVKRLLGRGDTVRCFSRGDYPELNDLGVEVYRGDVADRRAIGEAIGGCDVVFHLASRVGSWGPYREFHRTNVVGTQNVVDACRCQKVNRLVYTSSASVVCGGSDLEGVDESIPYPARFLGPYPRSKALAEQIVLRANDASVATAVLRPHVIWGPGDTHVVRRVIEQARTGQLRRVGRGNKLLDCVYVDDAADAHLLAGDCLYPGSHIAGKVYFITGGEPLPQDQLIRHVLNAAGLPPLTRSIRPGVAYALGWLLERLHALLRIRAEPRMTRYLARQLSTTHWFDISSARRDLGFRPAVTIEEGLRRLIGSLQERVALDGTPCNEN
jgi:2-alkyl-3-oxoalkanoate reductase